MNQRALLRIGMVLLVAIVGYFQKDRILDANPSQPTRSAPALKHPGSNQTAPQTGENQDSDRSPDLVVENMVIRDIDGSIAYRGKVDLKPVLDRIEAGERDAHENDGSVFGNRERKLPIKKRGYYREYVIRTPGIRHAGPQRLVIGQGGEVYYTHDHYQTFQRIEL